MFSVKHVLTEHNTLNVKKILSFQVQILARNLEIEMSEAILPIEITLTNKAYHYAMCGNNNLKKANLES